MATAEREAALCRAVWAFAGFYEALRSADTGDAQFVRQVAEALCARQTDGSGPRLPSAELEAALDGAVRAFAEFHEALLRAEPRDTQFVRRAADALLRIERAIAATESETR